MKLHRGRNAWACVLAASAMLLCSSAHGQELSKAAKSLDLVPADAATYSVMLRNREQLEAIAKSKAWARFNSLPLVKAAWQKVEQEWADGQLAPLREWYEKRDGKQLLSFLGDITADEVFFYGGKDSIEFLVLMQEINGANQFAPLMEMLQGGGGGANQGLARVRYMLHAIDGAKRLAVPDGVIGFRLKDAKAAQAHLDRLEKLTKGLAENPAFKDRFKKVKIGGGEFQTMRLDGEMVPWDMIPWMFIEQNQGEFEGLVKKLKALKFTVAVGVRDNFLLVGFGEGTGALEALGGKTKLADRDELKPAAKFADRRLTGISYVSKEAQTLLTPGSKDLDDMAKWITEQLKAAGFEEAKIAKVEKDLKAFAKDMKRLTPEPGAMLNFAFLTDQGSEAYSYDWTKNHGMDGGKPLTLLNHVGESPLFYVVGRSKYDPKDYETLVKWIKIGYGYVDEWAIPMLPPEIQQQYEQVFKMVRPLFERLDKATGKMLLPALADGQTAFVLDAKLKSKQWLAFVPPAEKDLPLLEPAIVMGVSDANLLRKAFKEYREIGNELGKIIGNFIPGGPALEIPEPETKDIKGGTIYSFPLPPFGLDPQIVPSAGLSKDVFALGLSQEHATRLLTKTARKNGGLAKADDKLASAYHLDWAGLMEAAAPWAEYGMQMAGAENEVIEQVQVMMQILKVFRSASGVTYMENGAVVSRNVMVIRDLEK